ncbi:MAG: glycosyltransferase family 2 protein [Lachnospiraceae bacterium]|nr:glycosyltransferase family 2 protein [Lachnospiraceae bacterium]
MKKIAAVICNYNKKDFVMGCIQSVLESEFQDFDLIVVDNASTDDSADCIRTTYGSQVRLFVNQENLGGSGGFNTGIRYAIEQGYEYVWCLDNDVLVDEKALGELYRFMEERPDVGMAGSRVYHMEAPDYVQQSGIDICWEEYCCEAKYYNYPADGKLPEVVYADAVAACSVLVRASLIKEIGPLPEENFLYWDDTEWGYRCNLAGYKVASLGTSKVLHSMGAKKETVNTFPMYYAWRNWIRFFMRYTPKEKWEDMCTAFLEGIFDVVYNDWYLGEENRAKTVMHAYDDALHGVMGKAGEDRIFPVIHQEGKLEELLKEAEGKGITIYVNGWEKQAEQFEERVKAAAQRIGIACRIQLLPESEQGKKAAGLSFTMTENIFRLEDMSLTTIYVDGEGRILATEEDLFRVINRDYSCQSFVFAQKSLFLHAISQMDAPL